MLELNEKTIASSAINYICNSGCYYLSSEELHKLSVILNLKLEDLERKSTNLGLSPQAEKEREYFISGILKIEGGLCAIRGLLNCANEKEKYICFNDIVRKSASSDGHRSNTEDIVVFPVSQMDFALLESNPVFDKMSGRKTKSFLSPIQSDGNRFVKRKVPNGEFSVSPFSNEVWKNKHSLMSERIKRIYGDKCTRDFYEIYKQYMMESPSDIISEYFSGPETILTITRPELGFIYNNYFLSNQT